jgi:CRISPR/Cas system-associated exonuclease Cas4 (RecB family)
MFGGTKVKLEKDLYERCKKHAEEAGYSSTEEFIAYTLEKELRKVEGISKEDQEEVTKRLKGLGYIE